MYQLTTALEVSTAYQVTAFREPEFGYWTGIVGVCYVVNALALTQIRIDFWDCRLADSTAEYHFDWQRQFFIGKGIHCGC